MGTSAQQACNGSAAFLLVVRDPAIGCTNTDSSRWARSWTTGARMRLREETVDTPLYQLYPSACGVTRSMNRV